MIDGVLDWRQLDPLVQRAYDAVRRERARLLTKEGRDRARGVSPFEAVRTVTVQSTFRALREEQPSQAELIHRDALVRWVHELLQERVAWDLSIDEVEAMFVAEGQKPNLAHALPVSSGASVSVEDLRTRLVTFEQARHALSGSSVVAVDIAMERLADLAPPVADVRRELRARRFEAARRLGLDHPWALATPGPVSVLAGLARAVLDATEPLAVELRKDLARRSGAPATPARVIHDSFARDAREGWPAHLTQRWLDETFRVVAPRPPRMTALPSPIGGASFLRAAYDWGLSLRFAGVARALPFSLARDPYPVGGYVFASTFALAVAERVFARRKLGLVARAADAHHRVLFRSLFLALRGLAAELLAGIDGSPRADELEELTSRAFGAPLDSKLAEAWAYGGFSGRSRVDAPARLLGALRGYSAVRGLVERFDEDWFDNPRAAQHLASVGAGPVWQHESDAATFGESERAVVPRIARAFEESLG